MQFDWLIQVSRERGAGKKYPLVGHGGKRRGKAIQVTLTVLADGKRNALLGESITEAVLKY